LAFTNADAGLRPELDGSTVCDLRKAAARKLSKLAVGVILIAIAWILPVGVPAIRTNGMACLVFLINGTSLVVILTQRFRSDAEWPDLALRAGLISFVVTLVATLIP